MADLKHRPGDSPPQMSIHAWKAVFKLSRMWNFEHIANTALRNLRLKLTTDNVAMIALYQELDLTLDSFFVNAVERLVQRRQDLSVSEGEQLGMDAAMKICTLRGEHRAKGWMEGTARGQIRAAWNIPQPTSVRRCNTRLSFSS